MATLETQYLKRSTETLHEIAAAVVLRLKELQATVGIAESLTGGGVMAAVTSVGGSSAVFRGGVVSYATPLKEQLLSVDSDLIARHGVIHADVAAQMAEGARQITSVNDMPATWGIRTTGVAGPTSQDNKPVGMVYIGIASPEGSQGWGPFHFGGGREQVREATVIEALSRLREALARQAVDRMRDGELEN